MVREIIIALKLFLSRLLKKESLYTNKRVEIIPDKLKPLILYIEGDGNKDQFAALLCPCGCGEEINLNLEPDEEPCWHLASGNFTDLSPSIWKSNNCKSHFFIKEGKVKWCIDNY
jgi:hypothetical protein